MIRKVILPKLVGEKLADNWYVEFAVFNEKTGRMVRFRKAKGFSKMKSIEQRRAYGLKQVANWEAKLRDLNYNPFEDNIVFITDQMAYRTDKKGLKSSTFDLRHFFNVYFETKRRELRAKSYLTYQAKVRIFLTWLENHKHDLIHPKFLTTDLTEGFCEYLVDQRRISNRSHNSYLQTLSTIWEYYVKKGIVFQNPWKQVDKKRFTSKSQRPFSTEQSAAIVDFLQKTNPWLLFFCEFQYHTLIRPGAEQTQILISDIDFYTQELIMRSEISKNKKTQRVAIPDALMVKIKDFKLHEYPGDYFIFGRLGPSPERAGRDHFSKHFRKVLDHLNIGRDWSMYSWKHTMNQRAAMTGIPLKEMQIQNRHHSLDQMDEYMKGLTVRDAKNLFTNIPKM
ncbi:MAG TPA: phage integrase SAM-like domain-containing protein [Bacteroidia bacterium]|nr:phage integrase SAM-like domain-containing protein [Bacteroidia bacterium]